MELNPFNIHSDFKDSLEETIASYQPDEEEGNDQGGNEFLDNCLGGTFQKLKYISNKDNYREYLSYYEEGLF